MVALSPGNFLFQAFSDQTGLPLTNGLLYTYISGTNTPLATYTDATGTVPAANPLVLNPEGKISIWLGSGLNYRFALYDQTGSFLQTGFPLDGISSSNVSLAQNSLELGGQPASYYLTALQLAGVSSGQGDNLVGVQSSLSGGAVRTQHQKNADYVSVEDFGADPTGVLDSTAAINTAIQSGAGVINFKPGTYKTSGVILMNVAGVSLTASDPDNTVISWNGTGSYNLGSVLGQSGNAGILISANNCQLINLGVTGPTSGSYVATQNNVVVCGASSASRLTGVKITGCKIKNCGDTGVLFVFANRIILTDNEVSFCGGACVLHISCAYGRETGNYVHDCSPGAGAEPYLMSFSHDSNLWPANQTTSPFSSDMLVQSNRIENSSWEGITTHGGSRIMVVNNKAYNVCVPFGVNSSSGSTIGPFQASCSGSILTLTNTTAGFVANMALTGNLLPTNTIITGLLTGTLGQAGSTYQLSTTPGTVSQEAMTGYTKGAGYSGYRNTISFNEADASTYANTSISTGVRTNGGAIQVSEEYVVVGNILVGFGVPSDAGSGAIIGVYLQNAVISDNVILDWGTSGVYLDACSYVTVANNQIHGMISSSDSFGYAVWIDGNCPHYQVTGNSAGPSSAFAPNYGLHATLQSSFGTYANNDFNSATYPVSVAGSILYGGQSNNYLDIGTNTSVSILGTTGVVTLGFSQTSAQNLATITGGTPGQIVNVINVSSSSVNLTLVRTGNFYLTGGASIVIPPESTSSLVCVGTKCYSIGSSLTNA